MAQRSFRGSEKRHQQTKKSALSRPRGELRADLLGASDVSRGSDVLTIRPGEIRKVNINIEGPTEI